MLEKIKVNKEIFYMIINLKGYSVIKLGKAGICNEKTIRRSLNVGEMSTKFFYPISELIDVYPNLLSGEIVKKYLLANNLRFDELSVNYKETIIHKLINRYPYFLKVKEDFNILGDERAISNIISTFEVSFDKQIRSLDFDIYIDFLKDFYSSVGEVVRKYVKVNAYGKEFVHEFDKLLFDIEDYHENYFLKQYVADEIRDRYTHSPPNGYSKNEIEDMTDWEIWNLHLIVTNPVIESKNDKFDKKYKKYLIK